MKSFYYKYKKLFNDYILYHLSLVKKINKKISNNQTTSFFVWGARFSQYLLNFGLDPKKIKYVLDNDIFKQNKRLYGTSLQSSVTKNFIII